MKKAIIGRKIGMTNVFTPDGKMLPVTAVEAGPCVVVQKKTVDIDGYDAYQVGFVDIKEKKVTKPLKGHFGKSGVAYKRYLKELKLDDTSLAVGHEIKVDVFAEGDRVDVTGTSKGKGYAGTIKRWGTHRGPTTHGSHYHRGPGSLGACSTPSRVMKGKKLPGHMGVETVTVANLTVVSVIPEHNVILIKGAVPGPKGGIVTIKNTVKA